MSKKSFDSIKYYFSAFWIILFCLQINAQIKETLIKKLPDGTEIYQRKSEVINTSAQVKDKEISVRTILDLEFEKQEFANQKLQVLLKNEDLKQEEIIWSSELIFPKNERAFNFFWVSDVSHKDDKYYVLYFRGLELRVSTAIKNSNGWHSENDTFLADTSESHNPVIEAKFIGKKPKVTAKRYYGGMEEMLYEWKQKKEKWILIKEKEIKIKPPWIK